MKIILIAVLAFIAFLVPARAGEPDAAAQEPPTPVQCEQRDTAWLAIRACTALLGHKEIDVPTRSRYLTSRGFAWLKEEEPKEALTDFTRSLELDGTGYDARTGRARANTALGDHTAAARDWTLAIESLAATNARPEQASQSIDTMYVERGTAWLAAGNTDAALGDFSKALELNTKNTAAHIARANTYLKLNDRDRALKAFELASKIDPSDIRPYMARAEAAEGWGDKQLAIESYLLAATTNPRGAGHARQALKRLGVDKLP